MFLQGSFLGGTIISSSPPYIPNFNKITVNGDLTVDKIRIKKGIFTNAQLDALSVFDEYTWTAKTLLYAEFNQNLSAGNIEGLEDPLIGFELFRRKDDETVDTKLAEFGLENTSFRDYAINTDSTYTYTVYGFTETTFSNPLVSDPFETCFFSWSLTNPETEQVYLFDLNVTTSGVTNNKDFYIYDTTYTEKPKVSYSNKDFKSGSISAIAGQLDVNGELVYPRDYLDDLKNFIDDKKKKYLKSRKGDLWIVHTSNFQFNYNDDIGDQIATITFDFTEVGGKNGSDFI